MKSRAFHFSLFTSFISLFTFHFSLFTGPVQAAERIVPREACAAKVASTTRSKATAEDGATAKAGSVSRRIAGSRQVGTPQAKNQNPIRPGDLISIRMKEDEDVKFEGEVGPAGLVQIPYLGKFAIAGKSEAQAEQALAAALAKDLYVKATLAVTVIKRAPGHVYIYGAVKQPGKVDLSPSGEMTILQALAAVKGVSTWASPRDAYVLRRNVKLGKHERITVNIAQAFQNIPGPQNLKLLPDDVIVIPSATGSASVLSIEATEVIVTGQVKSPGLVLFAPGEQCSFVRAIFKAGNFTRFAKKSKVRMIRYQKGQKREVRVINAGRIIDKGHLEEDFALQSGDMIIVSERRFNF